MAKEWEEAESDRNTAIGGVALGLAGVAALAIKVIVNSQAGSKESKRMQLETQLEVKRNEYNRLNGKWFPSDFDKEQMRRLKGEIAEINQKLNKL